MKSRILFFALFLQIIIPATAFAQMRQGVAAFKTFSRPKTTTLVTAETVKAAKQLSNNNRLPVTPGQNTVTKRNEVKKCDAAIGKLHEVLQCHPISADADKLNRFPGGEKAFWNYIYQNLTYPKFAADNFIEGRVLIQFTVA